MPLTIQFGPWAPDQSENPVQFYDQLGPVAVPCADCLNVIYTNGNYRSIASPQMATIDGNPIQPMAVPPVSAFSYFDTVEQQETVFAGTATGVQQLNADGSWSQISLITTQAVALTGLSMSFTPGHFANALTPLGQKIRTSVGVLTPVIEGTTFVAGGHTLNLQPPFTNIVYAGYSSSSSNPFGTLVTQSLPFGTLASLYDAFGGSVLAVNSATDPTQTAFTNIKANGKTYTAASAIYSYSRGLARWQFPAAFGFASGTTYQVVIT